MRLSRIMFAASSSLRDASFSSRRVSLPSCSSCFCRSPTLRSIASLRLFNEQAFAVLATAVLALLQLRPALMAHRFMLFALLELRQLLREVIDFPFLLLLHGAHLHLELVRELVHLQFDQI